jgi:DNA-binding winged helix-turn-helix (wHTH) protein
MNDSVTHFYEFGTFRLDVHEQQVWRNGEEIALTPKAFGVLLMLVRNGGHAVTKEDFMREVWPGTIVEEKNLTDNISILRQVLGDSPQEQRYIKTVPRRGYRFVAEVREVSDETLAVVDHTKTRIVMDRGYAIAYDLMWACYREKGMHTDSVTAQLESLRLSGFTEDELKGAKAAFESSGVKGFQRRQIELWKAYAGEFHLAPILIAMNYSLLGEKDAAFKWLETAREERHGWLTELKADPVWDTLRDEPRFIKLVEQVNIPE